MTQRVNALRFLWLSKRKATVDCNHLQSLHMAGRKHNNGMSHQLPIVFPRTGLGVLSEQRNAKSMHDFGRPNADKSSFSEYLMRDEKATPGTNGRGYQCTLMARIQNRSAPSSKLTRPAVSLGRSTRIDLQKPGSLELYLLFRDFMIRDHCFCHITSAACTPRCTSLSSVQVTTMTKGQIMDYTKQNVDRAGSTIIEARYRIRKSDVEHAEKKVSANAPSL